MPVARKVWQPISAAMPAALARRRIMHQASDWFIARSDSVSALWPCAVRNSQLWLPKITSGLTHVPAMSYSHRRDDRPLEAARRIARRTVQIACGSRSRDGISPPAATCPEAIRAGEAQAAHCRSRDLRLALSAVPLLAGSRGCLQA